MSELSEINALVDSKGSTQRNLDECDVLETKNISHIVDKFSDSDGEEYLVRSKRRVKRFSDSGSESEKEINERRDPVSKENEVNFPRALANSSEDSNDASIFKSSARKSRLCKMSSSEQDSDAKDTDTAKNVEHSSRIKSKRNKLKQKFKKIVVSRATHEKSGKNDYDENTNIAEHSDSNHSSEDEASSIEDIKQSIKEKIEMQLKSSLYDPDTSDEEAGVPKETSTQKNGKIPSNRASAKPAMRMSAKQAMENMQKIKSESNRMLREKDVSLPYHRPKALSLKDIMSRRKPAVSADGKVLPIKMNEEQLKQYAQQLEQRQKEMMELCKSDTDEDDGEDNENNAEKSNDPLPNKIENKTEDQADTSSQNDTLYDDLSMSENKLKTSEQEKEETENEKTKRDENINKAGSIVEATACIKGIDSIADNITTNDNEEQKSMGMDDSEEHQNPEKQEAIETVLDANNSAEMELVYNDSIEEACALDSEKDCPTEVVKKKDDSEKADFEVDSQLISLHYDTEKTNGPETINQVKGNETLSIQQESNGEILLDDNGRTEINKSNEFSDDDVNMEDIDALIENAEIIASQHMTDNVNSPMLIKDSVLLQSKPKLTGAPGMVIDLDGTDPFAPKKLSGVELLKERFSFFAKLKTPEELERDREKKIKPGAQHLKLKQELGDQIAEQRSLEWAKRLEEEKLQKKELDAIRGEGSDAEEDIDEIEKKLGENCDIIEKESSSESEEEEEEEEIEQDIVEKPRKRNPMVDDEAEESDCDEAGNEVDETNMAEIDEEHEAGNDGDNEQDDSEEDSSEESEESESEQQKPKKGRILKAFEDSDDEETPIVSELKTNGIVGNMNHEVDENAKKSGTSESIKETQDDDIQLAQMNKSLSVDLFTSQESQIIPCGRENTNTLADGITDERDFGTQTFSILESSLKDNDNMTLSLPDKMTIVCDTQSFDDNLDAVVGMCSGSFSQTQNLVTPTHSSEVPASQVIGDDVLALCTGQFYDNQFVSQLENRVPMSQDNEELIISPKDATNINDEKIQCITTPGNAISEKYNDASQNGVKNQQSEIEPLANTSDTCIANTKKIVDANLKSILDELNDPEFDSLKPNKYFVHNDNQDKENKSSVANAQIRKKFIIDSDDEGAEKTGTEGKKKKHKKRKLEDRALQISDDEEDEELDQDEAEDYDSEIEEDGERIIEYDSEENEVLVQPEKPKKKRKATDFFEQEAELTSEDEWVGSGDEDERDLDRMEREEGDDETFNQNKLQRELGQIHMRDVLDQDKRDVRLIQELLFEDGDLGGGHRQRKFRWRNADGEEEEGMPDSEFADTQEEEFESEEQWRKQRHEREMFLKSLNEEPEEPLNVSVSRTSLIKANLSKNSSSIFVEVNTSIENTECPVAEKKPPKDIPSPKKPFTIFQQNYHGSLLTRGRGALARLAALATPLATDDDTPKTGSLAPTNKRNFVFAAVDKTPDDDEPKVTKRKAETKPDTPRLVKKMRTEDKQKYPRSSLLEHLKI